MSRTHKYKAEFTRNIRREMLNVANTGYGVVEYGHNFNKYAFYESCHYQAKNWERTRYDTERADAIAMDKEWRRAQWKAQMKE